MEELRATIADKGLLHVLQMLDTAFGSNVEQLSQVFRQRARPPPSVLDLLGENSQSTIEIMLGMNDAAGTLEEAYQAQVRTINFQLNRATAAAKLAMVQLGAAMAPVAGMILDRLIPALIGAVAQFKVLPPWIQSAVGWLALLGPVLLFLGAALPVLGFAMEGMAIVLGAISAPALAVIAALAALAWGAYYLWGPQIQAAWKDVKAAFIDPVLAEIKRTWSGPSWETIKAAWAAHSFDPIIASIFPELDESDLTWAAIGSALSGRLALLGQFTALLLFPELDASDLTWAAVRAAISGRIVGLGKSLALRLFPELDESDLTWAAVGAALSGRIALFSQFAALILFP